MNLLERFDVCLGSQQAKSCSNLREVGHSLFRVLLGAKRKITVARANKYHSSKEPILPECFPQVEDWEKKMSRVKA